MAKKSWMARERKRRKTVAKYAEKRRKLKETGQWQALQKLPRDASPVRIKNRCMLTGRARGFLRAFGVCRIAFREMALDGTIPGVRKSSW
jgi:small subunit ribosomal protein S14